MELRIIAQQREEKSIRHKKKGDVIRSWLDSPQGLFMTSPGKMRRRDVQKVATH